MSGRGMSASMLTEVSKQQVKMVFFVEVDFSTPVYFTTHRGDLVFGGNTYLSSGILVGFSDIRESWVSENNELTLEFSGASTASISQALTEVYYGLIVKISMGFIDTNAALISSPILIYQGRIITFNFSEDTQQKTANLTWRVASIWNDFSKITGRKTNNHDHQLYSPGDKFFDHCGAIIKDIKWGSGG